MRGCGQGAGTRAEGTHLAVYKEMKSEFLAEGTDYGTREIREILKGRSVVFFS